MSDYRPVWILDPRSMKRLVFALRHVNGGLLYAGSTHAVMEAYPDTATNDVDQADVDPTNDLFDYLHLPEGVPIRQTGGGVITEDVDAKLTGYLPDGYGSSVELELIDCVCAGEVWFVFRVVGPTGHREIAVCEDSPIMTYHAMNEWSDGYVSNVPTDATNLPYRRGGALDGSGTGMGGDVHPDLDGLWMTDDAVRAAESYLRYRLHAEGYEVDLGAVD
jgi:hypothetical protein